MHVIAPCSARVLFLVLWQVIVVAVVTNSSMGTGFIADSAHYCGVSNTRMLADLSPLECSTSPSLPSVNMTTN